MSVNMPTPGPSSSPNVPRTQVTSKRTKATQACVSCRKHKTRCEILGDGEGSRCHRCKVLNKRCSFEESTPLIVRESHPSSSRHAGQILGGNLVSNTPAFAQGIYPNSHVSEDSPTNQHHPWYSYKPDLPQHARHSSTVPSQFSHSENIQEYDVSDSERSLPENDRVWALLNLPPWVDGNSEPLLTMHTVTRAGTQAPSVTDAYHQSLLYILGEDRLGYLLDVFQEHYSPWLNIPQTRPTEGSLSAIAQCSVACRHLVASARSVIAPQLVQLVQRTVYRRAFDPVPSMDTIESFIVLSLWEPFVEGQPQKSHDGRLLASSATNMALNLHLSHAMRYAKTLHRRTTDPGSSPEFQEILKKCRMWFCVTTTEAMLCLGTAKQPISKCDDLIFDMLDTSSVANINNGRDVRIHLLCRIFAATQNGFATRLQSLQLMGPFYKAILEILMQMDNLERLIAPLPLLAEHEVSHFQMLRVFYLSCRALIMVHAIMQMKYIAQQESGPIAWFNLAEHDGINLARTWGSHALLSSEGVLVSFLSITNSSPFNAVPDNVFMMITFSSILIIRCKLSVWDHSHTHVVGWSEDLLAATINRLLHAAPSPNHVAARCARWIDAFWRKFKLRVAGKLPRSPKAGESERFAQLNTGAQYPRRASPSSGHPSMSPSPFVDGAGMPTIGGDVFPATFSMDDPDYFFGSDIFLDNDFWASFMANLSEGANSGTS